MQNLLYTVAENKPSAIINATAVPSGSLPGQMLL